jgi:hypothetical protein
MATPTAFLFAGRIKGWTFCKEHLLEMKVRYNAIFFCSLNMSELDDESEEFCKIFSIGPDQLNIQETVYPLEFQNNRHSLYSQAFHVKRAFDILESYSMKYNIQFNTVIKYRADIYSDTVLEIKEIDENTGYFLNSAYGGINDQMYYGRFSTMKILCSFVDSISFLDKNGFFTPNYLSNFLKSRYLGDGEKLNNEEHLAIYIFLTSVAHSIKIIYTKLYIILHPSRKLDEWDTEFDKDFRDLYLIYKEMYLTNNFEKVPDTEAIFNNMIGKKNRYKDPFALLCAVSALVWPMP